MAVVRPSYCYTGKRRVTPECFQELNRERFFQVNINQTTETGNVLQREIDAFLASFRNPTTYFYQSNLGVGEVANVMLWAGFLFFCLVSIIREILVSRLSFLLVL